MRNALLDQSHLVIANLICGRRIAKDGIYQVLWIKDHFKLRKTNEADKESHLIIKLFAKDINEGLRDSKWRTILARLRTLIKTGVIK